LSPVLFVLSAFLVLWSLRLVWSRKGLPGYRLYPWIAGLGVFWCLLEAWEGGLPAFTPQSLWWALKLVTLGTLAVLGVAGIFDLNRQLNCLPRWQWGGMLSVPALGTALSWSTGSSPAVGVSQLAPPGALGFALGFAIPLLLFAGYVLVRYAWAHRPARRAWLLPALGFLVLSVIFLQDFQRILEAAPLLLSLNLVFFAMLAGTSPLPKPGNVFGPEDSLINRLSFAVLAIDASGRIVDVNESAALWAGMARQGLIGRLVFDYSREIGRILLESRRGVSLDLDLALNEFTPPRFCHLHLSEEPWKNGQVIRLITLEDNTRFVKENGDLRRDRALLESALETHHNGLMVTDPNGRVILRTANLLRTFNLPERAFDTGLLGWRNQMAQVMKDPARFHRFLDQTIQQSTGETLEMLEMASGRWLECRSFTTTLPGGDTVFRIWTFTDYTEQTRREQELLHLSTHDILTGVKNRTFFENELRRLRLGRNFPITLIITDVDGLKAINDQHGHPAGDEILRQTADILRRACRAEDTVARIGGDEFCILLKHAEAQAAEHVINRVLSLVNLYNMRQPGPALSLSIGYASAENPVELDTVFQRADSVMYAARYRKRNGGSWPAK
jgi:diguanylate cyclase (GGDEF)-like protein